MARRPRRAHPWLWTTVAAVVAGVWFGSYWLGPYVDYAPSPTKSLLCVIVGGALGFSWVDSEEPTGRWQPGWMAGCPWIAERNRTWRWWPVYRAARTTGPPVSDLRVPLWPVVLAAGFFAVVHWRRAKRLRIGTCPACGYSRAGLAAGAVCPECGRNQREESRER